MPGSFMLLYAFIPIIIFISFMLNGYKQGQKNIEKNDLYVLLAIALMIGGPSILILINCIFTDGYFDFVIRYGSFDKIQLVRYGLIAFMLLGAAVLFFKNRFINNKLIEIGLISVIMICAIVFYGTSMLNTNLTNIRGGYINSSIISFIFIGFLGYYLGLQLYSTVKKQ